MYVTFMKANTNPSWELDENHTVTRNISINARDTILGIYFKFLINQDSHTLSCCTHSLYS